MVTRVNRASRLLQLLPGFDGVERNEVIPRRKSELERQMHVGGIEYHSMFLASRDWLLRVRFDKKTFFGVRSVKGAAISL